MLNVKLCPGLKLAGSDGRLATVNTLGDSVEPVGNAVPMLITVAAEVPVFCTVNVTVELLPTFCWLNTTALPPTTVTGDELAAVYE